MHAARLHLRLAQRVQQVHMGLRTALKGQDVGAGEVFRCIAPLAVDLAVADEHHLHRRQRLAANAFGRCRQGRKHGIQRAPADLIQQHRRGFDREFQLQQRVVLAQLFHPGDEPRVEHRLNGAQPNRHFQRAARAHLGLELALQLQHPLGVRQKARARHCELEMLVAPVQQQHAQFFLQRRHAAGHGRLRQKELFRCARHALEGGHPVKGFDKTQVHGGGSPALPARCKLLGGAPWWCNIPQASAERRGHSAVDPRVP
ncbi:hypothetical protein D3C71_1291260 [compost metagenome]